MANLIRASFLRAGPLLARFGEARMPPPGGDFIGRRRLDAHLDAFKDLGARVDGDRWIELSAPAEGLCACRIFMDEPSVMGTENALMAAALTTGPTTIANAACEPHVQDLARLLCAMGAQVDGIGSNVMTVHGRDRLSGAEHTISADHIEVGSFMALAAATGGDLRIREVEPLDLLMVRRQFRRLGLHSEMDGRDMLVPPGQKLRIQSDLGDAIPKIEDGPWPAFPADLTSIALALATQAEGEILIFEKMFENRLFFVDKLVAMGARIHLSDPHRAVVSGPSRLHGERVDSPDIRAGMAMLIAALAADGTSAMRTDMTVPIARLVSTRFAEAEPPFRFWYIGNAYRAIRPQRGQMREFTQAGVELIGAEAPDGTAEIIEVLSAALDAVGLARAVIGLGDADLYGQLLDELGVDANRRAELLALLATHD